MDLARALAQLFGGGPQAAFIAVVCVACITLFGLLMRAHQREMRLAMRVVVLAEKLAPMIPRPKRAPRTGNTGAHATLPPAGTP